LVGCEDGGLDKDRSGGREEEFCRSTAETPSMSYFVVAITDMIAPSEC